MFRMIKLYFTDKPLYEQRKRYSKLQKEYRNKLKKQAKEFRPWSGWYMHEMIKTMLEFYYKTYAAGDCCYRDDVSREEIADCLAAAKQWADELDKLEELEDDELLNIVQTDYANLFSEYIIDWEEKTDFKIFESNHKDVLLSSLALEFLTEKYTQALYSIIGKHIWEWCD